MSVLPSAVLAYHICTLLRREKSPKVVRALRSSLVCVCPAVPLLYLLLSGVHSQIPRSHEGCSDGARDSRQRLTVGDIILWRVLSFILEGSRGGIGQGACRSCGITTALKGWLEQTEVDVDGHLCC